VNGSFGIDFSDPGTTVDDILAVSDALVQHGTCGFLATVITSPRDVMESCIRTIAKAMKNQGSNGPVLGIHVEGPFISPLDGYRGAHPVKSVSPPDYPWFTRLQEIAEGNIRIVTLAPEQNNAIEFIRAVSPRVVVAAGHTACSFPEAREAVKAGLTLATHIGNGCLHTIDRHNNPIVHLLACHEITLSFIPDGFHLPEAFIRLLLTARPISKLIAVSDAVKFAGMPPGNYSMASGAGVVLSPDGRLSLQTDPHIMAGSSSTLFNGMNFLSSMGVLTEEELWQIGFDNPLLLLGLNPLKLSGGKNRVEYNPDARRFELLS
jgi:N-acetylglucosamine-6-phosphate deacetylase